MRLPVPGPRDILSALEKGGEQVEALLGAVPRALALLERAEVLLDGASGAVARVRTVTEDAAGVVDHARGVVDRADVQVVRVTELVDAMAPSLVALQPTLETLAETTHPDEVRALVGLVDQLPELATRMESDVLPVLGTLGSVAPDLHELLSVSRELNELLGKIPGMGRLKRRVEDEEDEKEGEDRLETPAG